VFLGAGAILAGLASYSALQWLDIGARELLLFSAVWFAIGAIDEFVIDLAWLWLKLTGRVGPRELADRGDAPLRGVAAVLVPAWSEAAVIGPMIEHCLRSWPQSALRIYAGCYRNDSATLAALISAAPGDPRLRIVVHDVDGPTTKADCLNRLHTALCDDEARCGFVARSVILHDAEDMVHPAGLIVLDRALDDADFAQLPVRPEPQAFSPWIAGHYCDEFAEAHGKNLVVRDWLRTGIPAAGVGCAFSRRALWALARRRGRRDPFAEDCLTEDYESGLLVAEAGWRGRFLEVRDESGELISTREFFPGSLAASVRQKTRWLHGIAFQGWDRLGWSGSLGELWMRMRDRRGPLTALVLGSAYLLLLVWPILLGAEALGLYAPTPLDPTLIALLWFNTVSLGWRVLFRFAFTARNYGWKQGVLGIARMPVANVVAIMSGRRAMAAYCRALRGEVPVWEKTEHALHPVLAGIR